GTARAALGRRLHALTRRRYRASWSDGRLTTRRRGFHRRWPRWSRVSPEQIAQFVTEPPSGRIFVGLGAVHLQGGVCGDPLGKVGLAAVVIEGFITRKSMKRVDDQFTDH